MYVSLMSADHETFHSSRLYNPYGAELLIEAYGYLNRPARLKEHYRLAFESATKCLRFFVAPPQRLRAFWVRSQVHIALGDADAAIEALDDALTIASNLGDEPAASELFAQRGWLYFHGGRLRDASNDFAASLYHLYHVRAKPNAQRRAFEAKVNRQIANVVTYLMVDPHEAEWRLVLARNLLPDDTKYRMESFAIDQAQAVIYRLKGDPESGFYMATRAAEAYSDSGDALSASRLHNFVAELALDRAERCADWYNRFIFARIAALHNEETFALAKRRGDEGATLMAMITQAREDRLMQRSLRRRIELDYVVRRGSQMHSVPLQAQALKVLADDYASTGEIEASRNCHRQALTVVASTDLAALAVPSWRALA